MKRHSRKGRQVDGILLLDKSIGLTSNEALQQVKRLYQANKAGHTGSLDLLATGLLPICFGEATKFSQFLLDADKQYTVKIQLGARTITGDREAEVIPGGPVPNWTVTEWEVFLAGFVGEIEQTPPMYSAIKHQGTPLYKLARRGIEVERMSRQVSIYELHLLAQQKTTLELDVRCSKGTYIRTLAEDIGKACGAGAYVLDLKRTAVGPYRLAPIYKVENLQALVETQGFSAIDALLLPIDSIVTDWPSIELTEAMAFYARHGQAIQVPGAPTQGWVRLAAADRVFLGVGEILEDGKVAPRRLVV